MPEVKPATGPTTPTDAVMAKTLSQLTMENECVVCLDNNQEVFFVPCGHKVVCRQCAMKLFSANMGCPMCRTELKGAFEASGGWQHEVAAAGGDGAPDISDSDRSSQESF